MIELRRDVWDLDLSTSSLVDSSTAWLGLRTALITAADDLARGVTTVTAVWSTPMATSYLEYVPSLVKALREVAALCQTTSSTVDALVTDVDGVQRDLTASLARLRGRMTVLDLGPTIMFSTEEGTDDEARIAEEVAHAGGLKRRAVAAVEEARTAIRSTTSAVAALRAPWSTVASSSRPQWDAPDSTWNRESSMINLGDSTLITGTNGNDVITLTIDPATGETIVTIEPDTVYRVPRGQTVVLNAGDGQDRITVPEGTTVHLRFLGGAGDDRIDGGSSLGPNDYFGGQGEDSIEAGAGNDFLSGGAGRDYLDGRGGDDRLFGGQGNDVVYGMDGADQLEGGEGNDYLEGAQGDDRVVGGGGNDTVSGGGGDDLLLGGTGQDVLFSGDGVDEVHGQGGYDDLFVGKDDTTGSGHVVIVEYDPKAGEHIEITGSPEFVARVKADLEMMRSSPTGQHALNTLGQQYEDSDAGWWPWDSKTGLEIHEFDERNGTAYRDGNDLNDDGYAIEYNPDYFISNSGDEKTPVVVLFHELGHIFQFGDGTWPDGEFNQAGPGEPPDMVNNGERQNVGLPFDTTGVDPEDIQPDPLITENAFRDELGIPDRERY